MNILPDFTYHLDPIATGAVEDHSFSCKCCNRTRSLLYVGPVYSIEPLQSALCIWCIANGSAANRFDASFTGIDILVSEGISSQVRDIVAHRTPGFVSWQGCQWLSHCDDACQFTGDATVAEVRKMGFADVGRYMRDWVPDPDHWHYISEHYKPGGDYGIYKFQCIHCREFLFSMDAS